MPFFRLPVLKGQKHTVVESVFKMSGQKSDFPEELSTVVRNFHTSVASLEGGLKELEAVPRAEVMEGLEPLDKAKLELVSAYAVNSLFWMLLKTMGEDPKEGVKPELDRCVWGNFTFPPKKIYRPRKPLCRLIIPSCYIIPPIL